MREYLASRGIGPREIERFGIGFAKGGDGSLRGSGITQGAARESGLVKPGDDGRPREMFWDRITIPIHDARGKLCGFGGRVHPVRKSQFVADVAANTICLGFGDLNGYFIADRVGLSIEVLREVEIRREIVVIHMRKRLGGQLVRSWQFKAMQIAA